MLSNIFGKKNKSERYEEGSVQKLIKYQNEQEPATKKTRYEMLEDENLFLRAKLAELDRQRNSAEGRSENDKLKIERDFWVEQCRHLQNQLQNMNIAYSGALRVIELTHPADDEIRGLLADAVDALKRPVVGIEAVKAAFAMSSGNCQGGYTAVDPNGDHMGEIGFELNRNLPK